MFLTAMFGAIDANPFDAIGSYIDDGVQTLNTGRKSIDMNGQTITYGPVVSFNLVSTPTMRTITFSEPLPTASLTKRCSAAVLRIEFEAGGDTYAVGAFAGFQQRQKLKWGD